MIKETIHTNAGYGLQQLATAPIIRYRAFVQTVFEGLSKELVLLARCSHNKCGIFLQFSGNANQKYHYDLLEIVPNIPIPIQVYYNADYSSGPGITDIPEFVTITDARGAHLVPVEFFNK